MREITLSPEPNLSDLYREKALIMARDMPYGSPRRIMLQWFLGTLTEDELTQLGVMAPLRDSAYNYTFINFQIYHDNDELKQEDRPLWLYIEDKLRDECIAVSETINTSLDPISHTKDRFEKAFFNNHLSQGKPDDLVIDYISEAQASDEMRRRYGHGWENEAGLRNVYHRLLREYARIKRRPEGASFEENLKQFSQNELGLLMSQLGQAGVSAHDASWDTSVTQYRIVPGTNHGYVVEGKTNEGWKKFYSHFAPSGFDFTALLGDKEPAEWFAHLVAWTRAMGVVQNTISTLSTVRFNTNQHGVRYKLENVKGGIRIQSNYALTSGIDLSSKRTHDQLASIHRIINSIVHLWILKHNTLPNFTGNYKPATERQPAWKMHSPVDTSSNELIRQIESLVNSNVLITGSQEKIDKLLSEHPLLITSIPYRTISADYEPIPQQQFNRTSAVQMSYYPEDLSIPFNELALLTVPNARIGDLEIITKHGKRISRDQYRLEQNTKTGTYRVVFSPQAFNYIIAYGLSGYTLWFDHSSQAEYFSQLDTEVINTEELIARIDYLDLHGNPNLADYLRKYVFDCIDNGESVSLDTLRGIIEEQALYGARMSETNNIIDDDPLGMIEPEFGGKSKLSCMHANILLNYLVEGCLPEGEHLTTHTCYRITRMDETTAVIYPIPHAVNSLKTSNGLAILDATPRADENEFEQALKHRQAILIKMKGSLKHREIPESEITEIIAGYELISKNANAVINTITSSSAFTDLAKPGAHRIPYLIPRIVEICQSIAIQDDEQIFTHCRKVEKIIATLEATLQARIKYDKAKATIPHTDVKAIAFLDQDFRASLESLLGPFDYLLERLLKELHTVRDSIHRISPDYVEEGEETLWQKFLNDQQRYAD